MWQKINGEDMLVGYQVFVKVVKSSVGAAGRVANYWFYNVKNDLGFGVDQVEEVSRLSSLTGVVERRGGYYFHPLFPDGKVQAASNVTKFLKDNDEARAAIYQETFDKMKSGTVDMSDIVPMTDPDLQPRQRRGIQLRTLAEIKAAARMDRKSLAEARVGYPRNSLDLTRPLPPETSIMIPATGLPATIGSFLCCSMIVDLQMHREEIVQRRQRVLEGILSSWR